MKLVYKATATKFAPCVQFYNQISSLSLDDLHHTFLTFFLIIPCFFMIDTKPSCAYCWRVALELFLNELWPLEFLIHIYIVRHQLGVFITFSDISSYSVMPLFGKKPDQAFTNRHWQVTQCIP